MDAVIDKLGALAFEDDGEESDPSIQILTQAIYDLGHGKYPEAWVSQGKPQQGPLFFSFSIGILIGVHRFRNGSSNPLVFSVYTR